ncbi:MAG: FGGY-family carbohydrate kinase [Granulosicoccus sp.]
MLDKDQACVIGIDVGTSGVRTVVMNKNYDVVSGGSRCYFADLGNDPRSPALWWQGVVQALSETLQQVNPERVVAISVDGTSGTILAIDKYGDCLATPMMYNDVVSNKSLLDKIAAHMPQISAAGGATSGLAKAMMFSNLSPAHIVHQADWVVGKLSGDYTCSDANNALKSGYDPLEKCWPDWIKSAGFDHGLFPDVSIPGEPISTICSEISKRFGLSGTVSVIAGTTDGCASFLATGANDIGDAVTALGSTVTLKLLSDQPVFAPEYGVYSHIIGDKWLVGGASNTGGKVLDQFFSKEKLAALSRRIDPATQTAYDYYPLPGRGERFPINDPEMLPRMEPRPEDDKDFLHALLEGISAIEVQGYRRLIEHGAAELNTLCSVGGGSVNATWASLRKKSLNTCFPELVFREAKSEEAAAGTARLAVQGANSENLW